MGRPSSSFHPATVPYSGRFRAAAFVLLGGIVFLNLVILSCAIVIASRLDFGWVPWDGFFGNPITGIAGGVLMYCAIPIFLTASSLFDLYRLCRRRLRPAYAVVCASVSGGLCAVCIGLWGHCAWSASNIAFCPFSFGGFIDDAPLNEAGGVIRLTGVIPLVVIPVMVLYFTHALVGTIWCTRNAISAYNKAIAYQKELSIDPGIDELPHQPRAPYTRAASRATSIVPSVVSSLPSLPSQPRYRPQSIAPSTTASTTLSSSVAPPPIYFSIGPVIEPSSVDRPLSPSALTAGSYYTPDGKHFYELRSTIRVAEASEQSSLIHPGGISVDTLIDTLRSRSGDEDDDRSSAGPKGDL